MTKTKAEVRDRMMQGQAAALERSAGKRKRLPEAADHSARAKRGIDRADGYWPDFSDDERVEPVWASGAPESGAPESGGESPARLGGSDRNPIVIDRSRRQPSDRVRHQRPASSRAPLTLRSSMLATTNTTTSVPLPTGPLRSSPLLPAARPPRPTNFRC